MGYGILGQLLDRPTRKFREKASEKLFNNPLLKGTYTQVKQGYESGKESTTQYAEKHNVEKLGGITGHYAGQVENMWYAATGRGGSGGGGSTGDDSSVDEPGTRATTSRRFNYGDTGSTQSRRSLLTGGDTNRTQGKKAKTLTRKTGGR